MIPKRKGGDALGFEEGADQNRDAGMIGRSSWMLDAAAIHDEETFVAKGRNTMDFSGMYPGSWIVRTACWSP